MMNIAANVCHVPTKNNPITHAVHAMAPVKVQRLIHHVRGVKVMDLSPLKTQIMNKYHLAAFVISCVFWYGVYQLIKFILWL
jgi:hypothetical protein